MNNKALLAILKPVQQLLTKSTDIQQYTTTAVIVSPAEALRRQAQKIEEEDASIDAFRSLIWILENQEDTKT